MFEFGKKVDIVGAMDGGVEAGESGRRSRAAMPSPHTDRQTDREARRQRLRLFGAGGLGGAIEVFCSRHYSTRATATADLAVGPVAANYLYGPRCMKHFFFAPPQACADMHPLLHIHAYMYCMPGNRQGVQHA